MTLLIKWNGKFSWHSGIHESYLHLCTCNIHTCIMNMNTSTAMQELWRKLLCTLDLWISVFCWYVREKIANMFFKWVDSCCGDVVVVVSKLIAISNCIMGVFYDQLGVFCGVVFSIKTIPCVRGEMRHFSLSQLRL